MQPAPLLPLEEAQERLLALASPLGTETIPVGKAAGRTLAAGLNAERTQPSADLSAMDGYATVAGDDDGPWNLVGESAAGHPYQGELNPGETVRISTGAHMPSGSGAVILQENVQRSGDRVERTNDDPPSVKHVRSKGMDFASGDTLVAKGTHLGAPHIALARSGGYDEISVGRMPSVAIIDSGDELAAEASKCLPHQIPATNGAMLAAMAAPYCANIASLGPISDRLDSVIAAFDRAKDADVIVTSGGASVGDHDLIRPALEQWGAQLDFWRVAIKPGKPLLVAKRSNQIILGLPGNPVSSFVTGFLFLLPLLRHLAGATSPLPRGIRLPLAEDIGAVGKRTELVRAVLGLDGVHPIAQRDSSALRALSAADCLIRRDANASAACAGELVSVYLLQNGGNA